MPVLALGLGARIGFAAVERTGTSLLIWDNQSAATWDLAYPVGNGRLGALPLGAFPEEHILINEETIWHRSPERERQMPEDSFQRLERVRELEAAGRYAEADRYFESQLQKDIRPDSYQWFGWLKIDYGESTPAASIYRELNLETGIALQIYTLADGTVIRQEVFASAPDRVVTVHISADRPIAFSVTLDGARAVDGDLVKEGAGTGTEATRYLGRVRARSDGTVVAAGGVLRLTDTRRASLHLAVATDFNHQNAQQKRTDAWASEAQATLEKISGKTDADIRRDAVADHARYFSRVKADFGRTAEDVRALPTRLRLDRIRRGEQDPELVATYFQFGRYLLIAGSRPGSLPVNLQGLWNPHEKAPWGSDYHLNINLQMNYWAADSANLSEMHTPLFHLIELFQPTGREMARRLGMQGWCMPHSTDLWGHACLMSRTTGWGGSFLCGQWLTLHILDHYRFTRDPQVLETYWGVLTESVRFVVSWLIPGPEKGLWMARPSSSPENSFVYRNAAGQDESAALSAGNSFDQFIILQVFSDYLEAARVLGKTEDPLVRRVAGLIGRVYRPRVGEDGRLMEWRLPFREAEPGHRHISHLIGAYPGNQINLDQDRERRGAVAKSIASRLRFGGAATGWSRAWTIGLFARLSDAPAAYENLIAILRRSTLDNLWNDHPPFQIDGNFGATAAVVEMLLHSHNGEIKLLPALPEAWPDGSIQGLRARGDYTVDIVWRGGKLERAVITAGAHAEKKAVRVVYREQTIQVDLPPGARVEISGDLVCRGHAEK